MDLDTVDLRTLPLQSGYYSLGLLQCLRPDIKLIGPDQWQSYDSYAWLASEIESHLPRPVVLAPWEEDMLGRIRPELARVVNCYESEPVYWLSQLDQCTQKLLTYQHGLKCRILEFPYFIMNDCMVYYHVQDTVRGAPRSATQYLCINARRTNHRCQLLHKLKEMDLHRQGTVTVANISNFPEFAQWVQQSPLPLPYQQGITQWPKTAAQIQRDGIWLSGNVANFIEIQCRYDHPLVISAETSTGLFFSTEKSIWPLLLGRAYLISGRQGAMAWVQRFSDIDQCSWADVSYDSVPGLDGLQRLDRMLEDNQDLLRNAREICQDLKPWLEHNRRQFVRNLWKYFLDQIQLIQ